MARVGIITFLHNDNYGSSLQAYALQRVIRELGHECLHLDYRPDQQEKVRNLLQSRNHPKLILEGIRKRNVKAGRAGAREKSSAIPAFYERYMNLSPVCRNQRELAEQSRELDILVCGSDQIWNPVWLNPAYFLTFAEKETAKIAYAASLGVKTLPAPAKARMIRKWTEGFRAISVREDEGAALLKQMTGKTAAVMPDPVCLLSREEWEAAAEDGPGGDPYCLCYFIGENPAYWEKVRQIHRETGLRVLVMPVTAESYEQGYEVLDGIGPEGFLGAVRKAEWMVTDSFHGLAFATIFGIRTELMRRYREEDPENKNSRIDHFRRTIETRGLDSLREEGRAWLGKNLQTP